MTVARRALRVTRVAAHDVRGTASLGDFVRLLRIRLSHVPVANKLAPHGGEAVVNIRGVGPVVLRSGASDVYVVSELLDGDSYDGLPLHTPADVRLVLDLGANTGLVTRWLLARFPHARVIAVEPDPETCAVLRRNVANQPRAFVVEAGIGTRAGNADMSGADAIARRVEVSDTGSVEVLTIPQVLERAGVDESMPIDVLKCDVEGAERGLFADCDAWINRVRTLAIETHDGYTVEDVANAVRSAGAELELRELQVYAEFGNEVGVFARRAA